jgi:hypothetical protein
MSLATAQGKEYAIVKLKERREKNKGKPEFDNSSLPAGSPMYFPCLTCGDMISVPESYIYKPSLCSECAALKELGWLE